jgi:NAD(P)H-hydrate repair Nnr-like enzyme with NAD(P)H-hydrate dehydratase domain
VLKLLEVWEKPILLDADALNNLADSKRLEVLKERGSPTILTPHVGEFERLSGLPKEEIIHNLMDRALEFAVNNQMLCGAKVLKDRYRDARWEVLSVHKGNSCHGKGWGG